MKPTELKRALSAASAAARGAGELMRRNLRSAKVVNESTQHDIKLELDVRCQKLIERSLLRAFPDIPVLGEEGISGDHSALLRWVVDPIDGTVNFAYGIPHACVSIALQGKATGKKALTPDGFETLVGVVLDPFTDELFAAIKGGPALLNGRKIQVSKRSRLDEAVLAIGFSKSKAVLDEMLPKFNAIVPRVRKVRIMGAAALSLVYVAAARMDVYVERGVRLWDIAAGGLIIECAGGEFWSEAIAGEHRYGMIASNGLLRKKVERYV